MNFLVILICLTINYVWLKDLDRFSDSWFFRFRAMVENATADTAQKIPKGWLLSISFIYGVPLLIVGVLLLLLQDQLFEIPEMLLHILILLVAFDRTQPGNLASEFLLQYKQGNIKLCREFLQKELSATEQLPTEGDAEGLAQYFSKQLTYRCFEKMFVMFFWYMVAGPLGIVISYVSYQLRDSNKAEDSAESLHFNRVVIRVLEWLPMRLLALSFSLAGNFVKCFARLQKHFWDFSLQGSYAEMLFEYAGCALAGTEYTHEASEGDTESTGNRLRIAEEIEALQGLLERSQLIWLSVLALITIFGINY